MLEALVFAQRRWTRCEARRRATFPEASANVCFGTMAEEAAGTGAAAAAARLLRDGLALAAAGMVVAPRAVAAMFALFSC